MFLKFRDADACNNDDAANGRGMYHEIVLSEVRFKSHDRFLSTEPKTVFHLVLSSNTKICFICGVISRLACSWSVSLTRCKCAWCGRKVHYLRHQCRSSRSQLLRLPKASSCVSGLTGSRDFSRPSSAWNCVDLIAGSVSEVVFASKQNQSRPSR